MRSQRFAMILGLGLLGGFLVMGGCRHDNPAGGDAITPEDQTVDLDAPYGGFLAVDESPAFGDATLESDAAVEEQQADGYAGISILDREAVRRLEEDRPDHYALIAVWGDLRNASTNADVTHLDGTPVEWNGSMSLDEGAIRLLSLIDFERPEDGVRPRTLPTDIEWTSITHGDLDGLRVWLVVPQSAEPETLRFKVGDYARAFPTTELEALNENYEISDSLQLSLRAFRAEPAIDVRGFLRGRWGWAPDDSVGRFHGNWVRGDGARIGVMRGHYGFNAENERVFYGKYIDNAGHFRGFLHGTWEATTEGGPGRPGFRETGTFSGRWVDERNHDLGDLHGSWQRRGSHTGVFTGCWRAIGTGS
jgi:hypothetical protein